MTRRRIGVFGGAVVLALLALLVRSKDLHRGEQSASAKRRGHAAIRLSIGRPASAQHTLSATLSGAVVTKEREPVAGARVCATCASCEPTMTEHQRCTAADDNGLYALSDLPPIGLRVVASAAGFAPVAANGGEPILVPASGLEHVDVVLEHEGVELSGAVLDVLGGPIGGANVRIIDWQTIPLVTNVATDEQGHFALWVRPGGTTLLASAPGYVQGLLWWVAPSEGAELVLTPASSVEGVVFTADDRAVAGIEVRAHRTGFTPSPGQRAVLTGGDGTFVFDALAPGEYVFAATGEGYRGETRDPVTVGLGDVLKGIEITALNQARVSGRVVVDGTGAPCQEGMVILGAAAAPAARATTAAGGVVVTSSAASTLYSEIGPDGAVHFDAVPPGRYEISVDCRRHTLRTGPATLDVETADTSDLQWNVERGLGLTVLVVDGRNRPVPHATVELLYPETAAAEPRRSMPLRTDTAGRADVDTTLAPGRYTIRADETLPCDPVEVVLREGMASAEATLRLRDSGAIAVRVRTPKGLTIDGLTVEASAVAQAAAAVTAPPGEPGPGIHPLRFPAAALGNGRYEIRPLAAGRYEVLVRDNLNPEIRAERGGSAQIEVVTGQTSEASAVLARDAQLRGRVVDSKGAPLADVWVSAEPNLNEHSPFDARWRTAQETQRRRMMNIGRVLTDAEGRFVLSGLQGGADFTVRAELYDGGASVKRGVASGSTIELVIPNPATVRGIVTDAQGRALSKFSVRAVELETGATLGGQFSGESGEFELRGVLPGKVALTAWSPSGETAELHVDLTAGQTLSGLRLGVRSLTHIADGMPVDTRTQ